MKLFLVILLFPLFGCGGKKSHDNKIAEVCPYQEYVKLPDVTELIGERCFVNGKVYNSGESPGSIDSCNSTGCERTADDGKVHFFMTTVACSQQKNFCSDAIWTFSDCFKFLTADNKRCICSNGNIACK